MKKIFDNIYPNRYSNLAIATLNAEFKHRYITQFNIYSKKECFFLEDSIDHGIRSFVVNFSEINRSVIEK